MEVPINGKMYEIVGNFFSFPGGFGTTVLDDGNERIVERIGKKWMFRHPTDEEKKEAPHDHQ